MYYTTIRTDTSVCAGAEPGVVKAVSLQVT